MNNEELQTDFEKETGFDFFLLVPKAVLTTEGMTYKEVGVYNYLLAYADNKTGKCFPSMQRLMKDMTISKSTLLKLMNNLERCGVMKKVKRTKDDGTQNSNLYILKNVYSAQATTPQKPTEQEEREQEEKLRSFITDFSERQIKKFEIKNEKTITEIRKAVAKVYDALKRKSEGAARNYVNKIVKEKIDTYGIEKRQERQERPYKKKKSIRTEQEPDWLEQTKKEEEEKKKKSEEIAAMPLDEYMKELEKELKAFNKE